MKRPLPILLISAALVAALWSDYRLWLGVKGDDQYRSGDFSGALSTWGVQDATGVEDATFNCGAAAYRMGNYSAAIGYFRSSAAAADSPRRRKALYNLGTTQLRCSCQSGVKPEAAEGHLREAVTSLQESLALAPDTAAAANLKLARKHLSLLRKEGEAQRQKDQGAASRKDTAKAGAGSSKHERADHSAKPGKATDQDQQGARRRSAAPDKNEALRMLDEARGRETLRSAIAASAPHAPAPPPQKDW